MAKPSIANAYVQLIPSFDGGAKAISKEIDGPLQSAGEEGGKQYGGGMRSSIAGMAKTVFAPLLGAAALLKAGQFFSGSITEASGLTESINALNVSYGDASQGVQALGKSAATSLGLSNLEFNNLAVRFSSFSKTIAGDGGDVTGTLDDLTTRASDFASVMNLEVADAAQLFQSGLAGESEPLRAYGLDLSAASVEAYGLANGIAANGKSLTEAEKVQARYGLLMQQTAATQGDFANTSDQLANKQRIVGAQFDDIKARIGAGLLPAMSMFVGFLGSVALPALDSLGSGFQSLAGFISENAVPIGVIAGLITAVFLPALISMGVQATISAAKQVAAWVVTQASAIAGAAAQSLAVVTTVAGWVLMGTQSLIQAARMAAAWLIAMGPIGLVIAAVVGLAALIIANWDTIVAWTKQAWENVTAWLATAWTNISNGVASAWDGILAFFSAIPGRILAFFLNWTLPGLLIKNWGSIRDGASSMLEAVVEFFRSLPGRAIDAIGDLAGTLKAKGKALIQGLIDGILDKIGDIKGAIGKVASAIGDFLPGSPVKTGPLTKWNNGRAGKLLVGMLADGLSQTAEVDAAMASLTGRIAVPSAGSNSALGAGSAANGRPGAGGPQLVTNVYPTPGLSEQQVGDMAARSVSRAFAGWVG